MPGRIAGGATVSRGGRLARATTTCAWILTAALMLMVQAGGLVTMHLVPAGLLWPVYLSFLAAGLLALACTPSWRRLSVAGFALFWIVLGLWRPYALSVAPDRALADREILTLTYCAVLSCAALFLGLRGGLGAWRVGWLLGLALTGPIGVWELLTNEHLFVTPERPWPFRGTVAAATYGNPNNFGIVLLSTVVALLAWRASARTRAARGLLVGAAAFAAVLVVASQSRAAALGLLVVLGLEASKALSTRPGLVRGMVTRHLRVTAGVLVAGVLAVLSTFLVPPLAARNPVLVMLRQAMLEETARADTLRLNLIRVALRYLHESHYLGTGAGSFEPIMWNDPDSGIEIEANLHNAFVELLSQYGVVVFAVFLVPVVHLVALARRTRRSASMRPRVATVRTEMLGHLVAFAALGCTASSSLNHPVWWLMLANACACGAWLVENTPDRRQASSLEAAAEAQGLSGARLAGRVTSRGRAQDAAPVGTPR